MDPDRVLETVERVDDEAVEAVVEGTPHLSVDDVFDEQVRESIRKRDVFLDGDSPEFPSPESPPPERPSSP